MVSEDEGIPINKSINQRNRNLIKSSNSNKIRTRSITPNQKETKETTTITITTNKKTKIVNLAA